MFNKIIGKIQEKYQQIQAESQEYNKLLETTTTFPEYSPFAIDITKKNSISYKEILNICPDLNDQKALLIINAIPINELYLTVMYCRECKTNKELFIVPTTKFLWVMTQTGYLKYEYTNLSVSNVKTNIMSRTLNFCNILLEVNGTVEKIDSFVNIINNEEYRNNLINEKLQALCGIIPTERYINDLGSGISIDKDRNIVFHTKEFNYKYKINELNNYELLLDDSVIIEKKTNRRIRLTSNKTSCMEMNIRVTANDKMFIIPILEKDAFAKSHLSTSDIYINNITFAKKIIEILDNFDELNLNGE